MMFDMRLPGSRRGTAWQRQLRDPIAHCGKPLQIPPSTDRTVEPVGVPAPAPPEAPAIPAPPTLDPNHRWQVVQALKLWHADAIGLLAAAE
jgi:hypothetical protein